MYNFSPCECNLVKTTPFEDRKGWFKIIDTKSGKQIFSIDNSTEQDKESNNTATYSVINQKSIAINTSIEMNEANLRINLAIKNAEL